MPTKGGQVAPDCAIPLRSFSTNTASCSSRLFLVNLPPQFDAATTAGVTTSSPYGLTPSRSHLAMSSKECFRFCHREVAKACTTYGALQQSAADAFCSNAFLVNLLHVGRHKQVAPWVDGYHRNFKFTVNLFCPAQTVSAQAVSVWCCGQLFCYRVDSI